MFGLSIVRDPHARQDRLWRRLLDGNRHKTDPNTPANLTAQASLTGQARQAGLSAAVFLTAALVVASTLSTVLPALADGKVLDRKNPDLGSSVVFDLLDEPALVKTAFDMEEEAEVEEKPRRRYRRRARRRARVGVGIAIGGATFGLFLSEREYRRYRNRRAGAYYYREYRPAPGRRYRYDYSRSYRREGVWYVPDRFAYRRRQGQCHPVFKRGYYDGYRVLIRGRMCYDRYGRGFIVRGSRRVVDYY